MFDRIAVVTVVLFTALCSVLFPISSAINSYAQTEPAAARSALAFSTYFGGGKATGRERTRGAGIAVDKQGYVYITGDTQAHDFPKVNPAQKGYGGGGYDAFIAKFTPDGQKLVYSTMLGGGDSDWAERIAVDDSGNAYIAGSTYSRNFPTTPQAAQRSFGGGDRDGFIAKFSADGKLVYATLLGGDGTDRCNAIDVDGSGNAYVTGSTNSGKFAVLTGSPSEHPQKDWDVLVARLDPSGSKFSYVFRFGGAAGNAPQKGGFGGEAGAGIKVGGSKTVYVVGYTDSADFPIRNGVQSKFGGRSDGFVVRLGAKGADLISSTYLGGVGRDMISAVALDTIGNISVTGKTEAVDAPNPGERGTQMWATLGDFPMRNALHPELTASLGSAFVTRLNADLTEMQYSTYLNCGVNDNGADIAVDSLGNTYIIGSSQGPRVLQLVNPLLLPQPAGNPAFVIELAPDGKRIAFSTVLGNPFHNTGAGIAVDSIGDIYVIGETGYGGGVNLTAEFPTFRALQPERINKTFQTFISKITTR
jgi:hypothetical protein